MERKQNVLYWVQHFITVCMTSSYLPFAYRLIGYSILNGVSVLSIACLCHCILLLDAADGVGRSFGRTVGKLYRRQHRWFSTYQRLSYARYEHSVAVIAIFSLRLLTYIPFPLWCCSAGARARSIFSHFQCELSSCHRNSKPSIFASSCYGFASSTVYPPFERTNRRDPAFATLMLYPLTSHIKNYPKFLLCSHRMAHLWRAVVFLVGFFARTHTRYSSWSRFVNTIPSQHLIFLKSWVRVVWVWVYGISAPSFTYMLFPAPVEWVWSAHNTHTHTFTYI